VSKRSWWSSANFIAVPSLGQLSEGHTLVVPRQHVYSMGALGTDLLAELDSACDEIRAALTSAYVQPIWFEHGCVSEREGGCGIYHAHLHAVPVQRELIIPAQLRQQFDEQRITGFDELRASTAAGRPYLFYQGRDGDRYLYEVGVLPSQFMRRLVADEIGSANWDWRGVNVEPALLRCVKALETAEAAH